MQIRRTVCKKEGAEARFKENLMSYARKHRANGKWPAWFHDQGEASEDDDHDYPPPQPHPSTKEHRKDWDSQIQAQGPIGLFIESLLWHGMAVDRNFRIRQKNEPVIDVFKVPYQNLKHLIVQAAAKARTRAEWGRNTSNAASMEILEIDRDLSQVSGVLT